MRIWDIEPRHLCRQHLLGEHVELHAIWNILTKNLKGWRNHPETLRWEGKLAALYARHEALVREMQARGYKHKSPLERGLARGTRKQTTYLQTPEQQRRILKQRCRECFRGPYR